MGRATPPSCTRCHPSNSGKGDLDSIRAFRQKNLVCTRKGLHALPGGVSAMCVADHLTDDPDGRWAATLAAYSLIPTTGPSVGSHHWGTDSEAKNLGFTRYSCQTVSFWNKGIFQQKNLKQVTYSRIFRNIREYSSKKRSKSGIKNTGNNVYSSKKRSKSGIKNMGNNV